MLVKPIALYACDVWGGFNVKRNAKYDSLYKQLLEYDNTPYEHLNIKVSKHSLQLPKRTSNVACRAELRRLPLRHFILVSVLKFQARMMLPVDNIALIKSGYQSQLKQTYNSRNTLTYVQLCELIKSELNLTNIIVDNTMENRDQVKKYGHYIKDKSILALKTLFRERMRLLSQTDGKLQLYGKLKREYKYEKFLDVGYMRAKSLLKLRKSLHNFPIERGRYANPAVPRHDRICQFCRSDSVGDEFHVLMLCQHDSLKNTRTKYMKLIKMANPAISNWDDRSFFMYMYCLLGFDRYILTYTFSWLMECNRLHK